MLKKIIYVITNSKIERHGSCVRELWYTRNTAGFVIYQGKHLYKLKNT